MGKADVAVNQFMERKEIFADFVNGVIYNGQKVVKPENLENISNGSGILYEEGSGKIRALERRRDIRMKAEIGTYSVVFAQESQSRVHYAMPVRNMLYDALEYVKQIQELEKEHKRKGDILRDDEFLSGITGADRLLPVITTVFYSGANWDGKQSLYEMMDLGEDGELLKKYLPNYKINLVYAENIEDTNVFDSCLQQIFDMLKCRNNKKELYRYVKDNRQKLLEMDRVEMTAAMVLMGEQKRLVRMLESGEEETFNMCKAIDDLIEDGRVEGREEGRTEGRAASVLDLLGELGIVAEEIKSLILAQRDTDILKKWLHIAARADSMEAFMAEAGLQRQKRI